jgi:hypothetical protein
MTLPIYSKAITSWQDWEQVKNTNKYDKTRLNATMFCNASITSLEGSPEHVTGSFYNNRTFTKSLIGGPKFVGEDFDTGDIITSLEGAPIHVGHKFIMSSKYITSLEGIGNKFLCECEILRIETNSIKSNILGILLIKGLLLLMTDRIITTDTFISRPRCEALMIIDRHLNGDRDILACQEELISAGLKEYAKL